MVAATGVMRFAGQRHEEGNGRSGPWCSANVSAEGGQRVLRLYFAQMTGFSRNEVTRRLHTGASFWLALAAPDPAGRHL